MRRLLARSTPYFIRKWVPLNIAQHLYFTGNFRARLHGKKLVTLRFDGYQIENEIYWRGFERCHEGLSSQIWISLLRQLKPLEVWDIGANSGTYGILAKAIFPECNVTFFDPIPKAIEIIKCNLELNEFAGSVFEVALGDFDGTGEIYLAEGADFATSVTVNRDMTASHIQSSELKIQVSRADTLIDSNDLRIPNLIKLDVETFEVEVIKGFGKHFPADGIFLIEILSDQNASTLNGYFQKDRYSFYNIDDFARTFRKTLYLEKSDFYNYLIVPNNVNVDFREFIQQNVMTR